MIRHHPSIGQVDIFDELHGNHLWVNLNNRTYQPIVDALTTLFMVAKHFHVIADFVGFFSIWR